MALPDETALRLLAARKIEHGALPSVAPDTASVGKGSDLPCSLCEQPISASEYEYEYASGGSEPPRFHHHCQEIWRVMLSESRGTSSGKRR
jgi:hypothetical protein